MRRRNQYQHVKLEEILEHDENFRTFRFEQAPFDSNPGQFAMIWLPGIDEKPISLSGERQITVRKVGPFTEKLFEKKEGDYLDIRGPNGKGFPRDYISNVVLVGGGCGIAPLMYAFSEFTEPNRNIWSIKASFVLAAKRESELLFLDEIKEKAENFYGSSQYVDEHVKAVTEDGSYGEKGLAIDIELPKGGTYLICGPEIMMKKVADKLVEQGAKPEDIYLSMERYMKCAMGICGNCSFDGYRVCADGPVFPYNVVKDLPHFNEVGRSRTGEIKTLKELKEK